jgi:hypothetical protein
MSATVNGFTLPVFLTVGQVQALFPGGVLGLMRTDVSPPRDVLPLPDGSLILDHGGVYRIPRAPTAGDPGRVGASGDIFTEILRPMKCEARVAPLEGQLEYGEEQRRAFQRSGGWSAPKEVLQQYDSWARRSGSPQPLPPKPVPPSRRIVSPTSARRAGAPPGIYASGTTVNYAPNHTDRETQWRQLIELHSPLTDGRRAPGSADREGDKPSPSARRPRRASPSRRSRNVDECRPVWNSDYRVDYRDPPPVQVPARSVFSR